MLSQTSRYALNILGFLARDPETRVRGEEISRQTGIPANYLSKILNQLRKQGIVDAEKGWGGGFRLRPESLERPISDVLAIFDGVESTDRRDCLFGLPECDSENPCPLHQYWEQIRTIHARMLQSTTVADLATSRR
jgi:Rrf2 family protein